MELGSAYQLDQFDGHPVVAAINQQLEEPRGQRQEVVRSTPPKFANHVDNCSSNTGVFIGVHQALLDLGPGSSERLRVDEGQPVKSDQRLLSNVGVTMAHSG